MPLLVRCHAGGKHVLLLVAALDAHVAVLIYDKMVERDGARFLAQAQAALFSAPKGAQEYSQQ